jgi:hypothetical protein
MCRVRGYYAASLILYKAWRRVVVSVEARVKDDVFSLTGRRVKKCCNHIARRKPGAVISCDSASNNLARANDSALILEPAPSAVFHYDEWFQRLCFSCCKPSK